MPETKVLQKPKLLAPPKLKQAAGGSVVTVNVAGGSSQPGPAGASAGNNQPVSKLVTAQASVAQETQRVVTEVERSQPQPQAALPFADDGDLDGRQVAQFFRELGEGLEGVVSSSAKAKRGRGKNKNATPLRDKLHKNWGGKSYLERLDCEVQDAGEDQADEEGPSYKPMEFPMISPLPPSPLLQQAEQQVAGTDVPDGRGQGDQPSSRVASKAEAPKQRRGAPAAAKPPAKTIARKRKVDEDSGAGPSCSMPGEPGHQVQRKRGRPAKASHTALTMDNKSHPAARDVALPETDEGQEGAAAAAGVDPAPGRPVSSEEPHQQVHEKAVLKATTTAPQAAEVKKGRAAGKQAAQQAGKQEPSIQRQQAQLKASVPTSAGTAAAAATARRGRGRPPKQQATVEASPSVGCALAELGTQDAMVVEVTSTGAGAAAVPTRSNAAGNQAARTGRKLGGTTQPAAPSCSTPASEPGSATQVTKARTVGKRGADKLETIAEGGSAVALQTGAPAAAAARGRAQGAQRKAAGGASKATSSKGNKVADVQPQRQAITQAGNDAAEGDTEAEPCSNGTAALQAQCAKLQAELEATTAELAKAKQQAMEWEQMYETERREHAETQSQVEGVQEREKRAKSKHDQELAQAKSQAKVEHDKQAAKALKKALEACKALGAQLEALTAGQ